MSTMLMSTIRCGSRYRPYVEYQDVYWIGTPQETFSDAQKVAIANSDYFADAVRTAVREYETATFH